MILCFIYSIMKKTYQDLGVQLLVDQRTWEKNLRYKLNVIEK